MKKNAITLLIVLCGCFSYSQKPTVDSINRLIAKSTSDTQRINLEVKKLLAVLNINLDSGILLGNKTISEAKRIKYKNGEAHARIGVSYAYCNKGEYATAKENLDISREILSQLNDSLGFVKLYDNYGIMYSMQSKYDSSLKFYEKALSIAMLQMDKSLLNAVYMNIAIAYQQQSIYPRALEYYQKALTVSEETHDMESEAYVLMNMAATFHELEDYSRAEQSYLKAESLAKKLDLKDVLTYAYSNLSSLYGDMNKYGDQYHFGMKAAELARESGDRGIEASSLSKAARALAKQNKFDGAENLNRQAIIIADSSNQPLNIFQAYAGMGFMFKLINKNKKAIPYYEKALHALTDADLYVTEIESSYAELSECYEKTGNYKKSLAAFRVAAKIADSIRSKENIRKATQLAMTYEFDKKQQIAKDEQQKLDDLAKAKQKALIGGLILAFILAGVAFNGFKNKRKANFLLRKQKEEIQNALSNLKSTQAQLIQSEKMASLGELTAGIAHEIKNPLNFVNNFSEINKELIGEASKAIMAGNLPEAVELLSSIGDNEDKISNHGRRADAIVKGMLQHVGSSAGQKEPTDLNALADEYLRLAYQGLRAKDKSFNATLQTDFDQTIPKINIVPQDIGRALLNLNNNAFYAVSEKKKQQPEGYQPTILLRTKRIDSKIEIIVKDNGNGIPNKVIDKIFQPFFTTKPTGQGTGLGLSMTYDIVTKEHGGTIEVKSKEGEYAEFIVSIPV